MNLPNFSWLRSLKLTDSEGKSINGSENIGARLYEQFNAVQSQSGATEQQSNTNPTGQPQAPPAINGVHVSTGPGGEFQIAITDNGQINRGINYWAEHDSDPNFSNPHHIDMGQSRNASVYMGSQTLYWRAYSSYDSSPSSPAAYHGSASQPIPVTGGIPGLRSQSQGAGTGAPGQGLHGPGPVQTRTADSGFDWTAQGSPQNKAQLTP